MYLTALAIEKETHTHKDTKSNINNTPNSLSSNNKTWESKQSMKNKNKNQRK